MTKLEYDLAYLDIRLYRTLAERTLRKQEAAAAKCKSEKGINCWAGRFALAKEKAKAAKASSGGWFSWWSGSGDSEKAKKESEAIQKQLYETIEYDEGEALNSLDLPPEVGN